MTDCNFELEDAEWLRHIEECLVQLDQELEQDRISRTDGRDGPSNKYGEASSDKKSTGEETSQDKAELEGSTSPPKVE